MFLADEVVQTCGAHPFRKGLRGALFSGLRGLKQIHENRLPQLHGAVIAGINLTFVCNRWMVSWETLLRIGENGRKVK